MLNRYQFIGNLGDNADLRHNAEGDPSIHFSVAISENYTDRNGEKKEFTTWVNCVMWKKKGDSTKITYYLNKGTKVYVEGKPSANGYTAHNGEVKASLNLRVMNVILLGSKVEAQQKAPMPTPPSQYPPYTGPTPEAEVPNPFANAGPDVPQDDDLPF